MYAVEASTSVALVTPALSSSSWMAPMPPPISSRVAPSTPAARSTSSRMRVLRDGPFRWYAFRLRAASRWLKSPSIPWHWQQSMIYPPVRGLQYVPCVQYTPARRRHVGGWCGDRRFTPKRHPRFDASLPSMLHSPRDAHNPHARRGDTGAIQGITSAPRRPCAGPCRAASLHTEKPLPGRSVHDRDLHLQ